jgi:SAM-dependent methyltransferase
MRTWEETIKLIRTLPEFNFLVENAYFDEDLQLNVERFRKSEEFIETLKELKRIAPQAKTILDVGSGNGISSVAFALNGYTVTSVEPDNSETIGAGAIRKLKEHYRLKNLNVLESFAERMPLDTESFDVVYFRQAMHHAHDLIGFISECSRLLKKGGALLAIRDHVIFDEEDKQLFLQSHPLHKFYGGENAYTLEQYKSALTSAGLIIQKTLPTFSSPINYFPAKRTDISMLKVKKKTASAIIKVFPGLFSDTFKEKVKSVLNEKEFPGRVYSFICTKR